MQPGLKRKRTQIETTKSKIEGAASRIEEEAISAASNAYQAHIMSSQKIQFQTNDDNRWISSQQLSEQPLTLHINKLVSSQDQSDLNHVMMIGPTSSSRQVLFACASTGEMPKVSSEGNEEANGHEPSQAMQEQRQYRTLRTANKRIAPPSVVINMHTPQQLPTSALAEKTPVDTFYDNSQKLYQQASSRKLEGLPRDIDMLMSVADDISVAESKLTNRTSQNPSALLKTRLEPTMACQLDNSSYLRNQKNTTPSQLQQSQTEASRAPFQGRTLLQKIQFADQTQKTWQLDERTGQVLVRDSNNNDINKATLYTQTQNQSSLLDSQTRKTLDSGQDQQNYIRSQRYYNQGVAGAPADHNSGNFKQAATLVAESLRNISSFRPTHGDCGSTLVKVSGGSNSIGPASFTQLDSPSMNQKQFAKNQPVITISGHNANEEYMKFTGSIASGNVQDLKLRPGIKAKRYGALPKRVQSANLNTQAHKSRRPGRLDPAVRGTSINQSSSKQLRSSQGPQSRGTQRFERTRKVVCATSVKTGPLHAIEPHNFTVDFDSPPESPKSSIVQQRLGNRPRTTKSGRPTSSVINNKPGQLLRQKSPPIISLQDQAHQTIGSVRGKNRNLVDSYNQHKMAEQLLFEEEQMAHAHEYLSQALLNQLSGSQEPEYLLKRDDTKGTSRVDERTMEQLLTKTKYDSRQNILLAKNPHIIRKETFGNNEDFQLDTVKAILEVVSKQSAADLSALARSIPYQLMFPTQQQELREMELQGTNVGDITLQKDTTKQALFSFLGRLQDYQAGQQGSNSPPLLTVTPSGGAPPLKAATSSITAGKESKKRAPPLKQGQITKRLLDQNKRRRMWSSSGRVSLNNGPGSWVAGHSSGSRVTSAGSKVGLGQARLNVASLDDYGNTAELRISRAPEAIDAYVYESAVAQMKQVYASGESHQSTYQGSAIQHGENQSQVNMNEAPNEKHLKLGLFPNDDSELQAMRKQLRASVEIERLPDTCYKNRQAEADTMRKSFEPVYSSNVQVQSIQIAFEAVTKKKRSAIRDSNSSNSNKRKFGGVDARESLRQQPHVINEAPDAGLDLEYQIVGSGSPDSKLLGKSQSFVTGSSQNTGVFKLNRKRCQSALPANKKFSRSNRHINNKSSQSQTQLALEVKGRPISREFSKPSIDANSSKKYSPIKEQQQVVIEEQKDARTSPENMHLIQTIVQAEPDCRTPQSNVEDPTPHGQEYLTFQKHEQFIQSNVTDHKQVQASQPLALVQEQTCTGDSSADFRGATDRATNQLLNRQEHPSISTQQLSPGIRQRTPKNDANLKDRRQVSPTGTSTKRQLKAPVEPINTDLVMCDENDSNTISAKDKLTTSDRAPIIPSTQQHKLMQRFGKALQDNQSVRLSFPGSSVDVVRAYNQEEAPHPKQGKGGKDDHFRIKRKTEYKPPSRNEADAVEFLLSHNSTAKMDIVSSNNDGKSELPSNAVNKIISPQSQIGQVYHKTNLTIFQRSKQPSKTIRGDSNKNGVALTNFNNHIIFNPSAQPKTPETTTAISRHNRVQSAHFFRRHRNRSKQKQQAQTVAPCSNKNLRLSSQYRRSTSDKQNYQSICQDCKGVRPCNHPDGNCRAQEGNHAPTQFVISAIEHAVPAEGFQNGAAQLSQDQSGKQTFFSPSEQQFVIDQLQELPIELTQQLVVSGHQSTAFASQTDGDELQYHANLPSQPQQSPVKILGHKTMSKHKKGLSLVSYPKNFLEGPRNKIGGMKTTKAASATHKAGYKIPKRKSLNLRRTMNLSSRKGTFSPPLEVVNSQAMILEQRRIQTNLDALIEQQQSDVFHQASTSPSQSIRLGITTMLGASIQAGARHGFVDAATLTSHGQVKKSDLAHLNENSNCQVSDDVSMIKDGETNHGGFRFVGNADLAAMHAQHHHPSDKRSFDQLQAPHSVTNQYFTQMGSQPNSIIQQSSQEYVQVQDKDILVTSNGTNEGTNSQHNRSGTRRNIISRQSSTCQQKMTPQKVQNAFILRHGSEDNIFPQSQKAAYEIVGSSTIGNVVPVTNDYGSQQALMRDLNIHRSLGSQVINALDADSDKGMIASLLNRNQGSNPESQPDSFPGSHPGSKADLNNYNSYR